MAVRPSAVCLAVDAAVFAASAVRWAVVTLEVRPSAVCVSWDWLAYLASASLVLVYSFETWS